MKNSIRSNPIHFESKGSIPAIKKKVNEELLITLTNTPKESIQFDSSVFANLKCPPLPSIFTTSPINKVRCLEDILAGLKETNTNDLRRFIRLTERDFSYKIADLKKITRLDSEEFRIKRGRRWRKGGFVAVERKTSF